MLTVYSPDHGAIPIPPDLDNWQSFLRWRSSDDVPENLKAHYYRGRVWIDLMEEYFTHNQVKAELSIVLGNLIRAGDLGRYVPDGMLLRNEEADLGTEPDAMFISHETTAAGRVTKAKGKRRGAVATILVGTPDLVVEVVSLSSEDADTAWAMSAYHNAGIPEYWLVNARQTEPALHIYRRRDKGYVAARRTDGWSKSGIFGRSFRLVRITDRNGDPDYRLEIR